MSAPARPRFAKTRNLRPPSSPACGSGLVINLESPFISQWDIVTVYALLFTALVTPYEIGFVDLSLDPLFWINRLVDTVFLADIVLNFFISYTDEKGDAVKDLRRIGKRYLGTWFCIDIGRCLRVCWRSPRLRAFREVLTRPPPHTVSLLPFDVIAKYSQARALARMKPLRLIRLLRLLRIVKLVRASRILAAFEVKVCFGGRRSSRGGVAVQQRGSPLSLRPTPHPSPPHPPLLPSSQSTSAI